MHKHTHTLVQIHAHILEWTHIHMHTLEWTHTHKQARTHMSFETWSRRTRGWTLQCRDKNLEDFSINFYCKYLNHIKTQRMRYTIQVACNKYTYSMPFSKWTQGLLIVDFHYSNTFASPTPNFSTIEDGVLCSWILIFLDSKPKFKHLSCNWKII